MLRRLILIVATLCLSVASFGFIRTPNGTMPAVPEQTQELLQKQQSLQGVVAPVHMAAPKLDTTFQIPVSSAKAESVISNSANVVAETENSAKTGTHQTESTPSMKGPMGAIALGIGAFLVFWVASKRQRP